MDVDKAVRVLTYVGKHGCLAPRGPELRSVLDAAEALLRAHKQALAEVARLREALTEMTEWAKKNREWFLGSNQLRAKFEREAILLRLALEGDAEARAALAPQAESGQGGTSDSH